MSEESPKAKVSPEDTGRVLYYLVGSKTDEFLSRKETLDKVGLGEVDRDDLYLEMNILNMFIMINQYTHWEKDQTVYPKALDQMHFLLFHQLKEHSNYDEDDIEQLHQHIFRRYDEYGDALDNSAESNWRKTLAEEFIQKLNDDVEEDLVGVTMLTKYLDQFYKAIPNMLNNI